MNNEVNLKEVREGETLYIKNKKHTVIAKTRTGKLILRNEEIPKEGINGEGERYLLYNLNK